MITLEAYMMGRDVEYPPTLEMRRDANDLLSCVEALCYDLGIEVSDDDVTSGYRPGRYNTEAGGSENSAHLKCVAIDLGETEERKLSKAIVAREDLLKKHGLYMESPKYTVKTKPDGTKVYWVHLQTRATRKRIFIPY